MELLYLLAAALLLEFLVEKYFGARKKLVRFALRKMSIRTYVILLIGIAVLSGALFYLSVPQAQDSLFLRLLPVVLFLYLMPKAERRT